MIDHGALVEFTRELVMIPSVYDPATGRNEEAAARLVTRQLVDFGFAPVTDIVAPGRPNVICTIDGGRPGPTLCFEGHLDVVTEGDAAAWTFDPFAGVIDAGKLHGRGSADMKSGLAAAMFAARNVADRGPFPGRIVIAALVDEEGMMSGAKHFVASGMASGIDAAICCEPEGGEVCHVAKGALRLQVGFRGSMAHGAMPFMGRNPNRAIGTFLTAIADFEAELQLTYPTDPYLGEVWVTPTVLRAGEPVQMNVMPADASVWLDVRTIPGVNHLHLVDRIHTLASAAGDALGITATMEIIDDRPAVHTEETSLLVESLRRSHEAVLGEPSRLGGVPGATDGTVLTSRGGIPTVVYGPGGKWIAHQVDEFVEVHEIVDAAEVYTEAALRFLAGP